MPALTDSVKLAVGNFIRGKIDPLFEQRLNGINCIPWNPRLRHKPSPTLSYLFFILLSINNNQLFDQ
jgi:hypothetical protein